jgi:hypothetical protein
MQIPDNGLERSLSVKFGAGKRDARLAAGTLDTMRWWHCGTKSG